MMRFFTTYGAWLLLPILGFFFGALASTANPVAIGVAVSSFAGIFLLKKPIWNVELVIVLSLVIDGTISMFFDEDISAKLAWGICILSFLLLIEALYILITTPQLVKSTPVFIWIALLFFIYAIVNIVLQFYSVRETIGGFKRYFQAWGLLFSLCWMDFSKKNIDRWRTLILVICGLLQIPFCLYQRIVVVPSLEGYVDLTPGLVPIDVVGGTFGSTVAGGGNSAEMATALIMVFAFLLSRFKGKIISAKEIFLGGLLILSPLFMGETKIVVIFFPLMIFVLFRKELLAQPHYAVIALIFAALFTVVATNVYMVMTKMTFDDLMFDTLAYNVYDLGYGDNYLNRTTVLSFWAKSQSWADPISFLFGNGLGSSQEAKTVALGSGHMDMRYPNYGIGLTGASILLWELGIVGVGLFFMIFVLAWRCANRLMAHATDPMVRADAAAIQVNIVLFGIFPIYSGSLLSTFSFQIMFSAIFGYLAWLHKQYADDKT